MIINNNRIQGEAQSNYLSFPGFRLPLSGCMPPDGPITQKMERRVLTQHRMLLVSVVKHLDVSHTHEEFRLMSACQQHIVANSSFSLWGAWLNKSARKMVFAPKQWFLADEAQSTADTSFRLAGFGNRQKKWMTGRDTL